MNFDPLINWLNAFPERWIAGSLLIALVVIFSIMLIGERIISRSVRKAYENRTKSLPVTVKDDDDFFNNIEVIQKELEDTDKEGGTHG